MILFWETCQQNPRTRPIESQHGFTYYQVGRFAYYDHGDVNIYDYLKRAKRFRSDVHNC
jgi:hypothetical protein